MVEKCPGKPPGQLPRSLPLKNRSGLLLKGNFIWKKHKIWANLMISWYLIVCFWDDIWDAVLQGENLNPWLCWSNYTSSYKRFCQSQGSFRQAGLFYWSSRNFWEFFFSLGCFTNQIVENDGEYVTNTYIHTLHTCYILTISIELLHNINQRQKRQHTTKNNIFTHAS